ncbi:hypothetical protein BDY19DRAFT_457360 [Irpex rosettiformis]|uniref:Uncharacterized protein n=1 Tax=Irpex rosettiformis TaxID=378272 RepID=A0ACB8TT28_9APHY|nr:hypothetical protein BDY19DRAFT_457360 [Irpex rosettiformis]
MLFQNQESSNDPFNPPGLEPPPSVSSLLTMPPLLPLPRGRTKTKSAASSQPGDQEEEVLTAKQPTFEFPPRSTTPRSVLKQDGSNALDAPSNGIVPIRERPPPLGAGIPRSTVPLIDTEPINEVSVSIGLQEISETDIFTPDNTNVVETPPAENAQLAILSSSPEKPSPRLGTPAMTRHRSKSSAVESFEPYSSRREWNFPSKEFQFPPPGFTSDSALPTPSSGAKTHNRISPTHASASTISSTVNSSRSSHQFTQSLDASAIPRRLPSPVGLLPAPPNANRSQSATPFRDISPGFDLSSYGQLSSSNTVPKKPSMTRLASVAVMETVQTPSRSFSRNKENRSGSLSDAEPPLPGLRDVLKIPTVTSEHRLGMSDLLPPSPSAVPPPRASPSPSPLGSTTPADGAQYSPRILPYANFAASSSSTSLNSLSSLQNHLLGNELSSSSVGASHMRSYSYSALHAAFTSSTTNPLTGPMIRPLDFGAFIHSHEGTHSELARTVEDLAQWLSVVEIGLSSILDKAAEHTIEEEQEQEETLAGQNGTLNGALSGAPVFGGTSASSPVLATE